MATVTTDQSAYQDLETIRSRVDYEGDTLFEDNDALRFDELLVRLEKESRGIFETLWGDQTPAEETDRVDTMRTTGDAAMTLVYPVQDVTKVEYKVTVGSDWEELDADRWDYTDHHLVLAQRPTSNILYRTRERDNPLTRDPSRAEWDQLATKVRVTYDRGFSTVPSDIKSIQISLINKMLRQLRAEQNVSSVSPEELTSAVTEIDDVVDENIRQRISDVTSPGLATMSI